MLHYILLTWNNSKNKWDRSRRTLNAQKVWTHISDKGTLFMMLLKDIDK